MQSKSESLYFRDINKYELLTDEEERVLVEEVKKGVKGASDKLITANLRFVVSVAKKYRGRGLTYLELINEGNLGLLKAAHRFDSAKDVKFISYAVWWIRQSIQKAVFEQSGTVRIPMNKITLVNKFRRALDRNDGDFEKTINMPDFADSKLDILEVLDKSYDVSLDSPIAGDGEDDGSRSLLDTIGEDPTQEEEQAMFELSGIFDKAMEKLDTREEKIIRMYYGIHFSRTFTLEEIGKELNLTRERVRLMRDRALRKLSKNQDTRDLLLEFLSSQMAKE